ncbi:MAG: N-formylglutamate deformylase [Rhizomicrobium sp.]
MTFLDIHRGEAPLIVSFPHTGTELPTPFGAGLISPWLARKDADWWVDRLYDFARDLGATTIRTTISRSIIDVNRDPSGASLYPGRATTELCPTTTFDGEALYRPGEEPDADQIGQRRAAFFAPYHAAILLEIGRLRARHDKVVLYDAHSIRSDIPRLFEGRLPHFNIGTNHDATCDQALTDAVEAACARSKFSQVTNGRFTGGWTTRHYGQPSEGVHALQMELACRGYMDEPGTASETNWPSPYDADRAAPLRSSLFQILKSCIAFAQS